jgi:hypothetical protein
MAFYKGEDRNQAGASSLPAPQPSTTEPAAKTLPGSDPNLIKVFDEFGRELFITKEQWRTNVLPGSLKSGRDHPDKLYGTVVGSLNDGLYEDVLAASTSQSLPVMYTPVQAPRI